MPPPIPYFPMPPRNLKKQWSAGGGVSLADAQKHMANYNRWAKQWNEQERAFQAGETNDFPEHDSPNGHFSWYPKPKNRWLWCPTDGPWLRVTHKFKYIGEPDKILEWPLTLVANVKGFRSGYHPREYVTPEQIVWASWANFWDNSRVRKPEIIT